MFQAVRSFGEALKGGVGLFYYAGHGVQVKGRNFLVPVDAQIEREDELPYKAFDIGLVIEKMEAAHNPLNIVILDACRNNPFVASSRSVTSGLAQMDAPSGSLIAFATAPGATAEDGRGSNGLYTSHLLRQMATPGLAIEEVFKRTRVAVKQSSSGRQIPWESTSLEGSFSFAPGSGADAGTTANGNTNANATATASIQSNQTGLSEQELWTILVDTGTPSAYRAYLDKYPQGSHAQDARTRLSASNEVASAGSRTAAAPSPTQPAATRAAGGFSFSAAEAELDRRSGEGRIAAAQQAMAGMACPADRRKARVRVQLDEPGRGGGAPAALQTSLGAALSSYLRDAGFKVENQGTAAYTVHGTVSAQSHLNNAVGLREVSVSSVLGLAGPRGVALPDQILRDDSYAGEDTQGAQAEIMQRQGAEFAAKVVRAICAP
jgi:uncharacterized caspase-like protein